MPGMAYPMGMQQQQPGMPNMMGNCMSGNAPVWHGNASVPSAGSSSLAVAPQGGMVPFPDVQSMQKAAYQQAAAIYETERNAGIAPEIAELVEHHGCDERSARALHDEMQRRHATFEEDMEALWIGLEGAKNPSGLLMMKIKDMRMGTFRGMSALKGKVHQWAKKNNLDTQAAVKLAEVLDGRDDPEGDMVKLERHMERSNKPSSLMMMMLKDLRDGKPIKEPTHAAAIGSRAHQKELDREHRGGGRSRSRSRGRRDRDRRRSRDRRSRDRRSRERRER